MAEIAAGAFYVFTVGLLTLWAFLAWKEGR